MEGGAENKKRLMWKFVAVTLHGPFEISAKGNCFLITIVDPVSR